MSENTFPILCRAWGETDLPGVLIAKTRGEVSQFMVREWFGSEADPVLAEVMEEFDEHDWRDEPLMSFEFEIGGVSFERVYESGASHG